MTSEVNPVKPGISFAALAKGVGIDLEAYRKRPSTNSPANPRNSAPEGETTVADDSIASKRPTHTADILNRSPTVAGNEPQASSIAKPEDDEEDIEILGETKGPQALVIPNGSNIQQHFPNLILPSSVILSPNSVPDLGSERLAIDTAASFQYSSHTNRMISQSQKLGRRKEMRELRRTRPTSLQKRAEIMTSPVGYGSERVLSPPSAYGILSPTTKYTATSNPRPNSGKITEEEKLWHAKHRKASARRMDCQFCLKQFAGKSNLEIHQSKFHPQEYLASLPPALIRSQRGKSGSRPTSEPTCSSASTPTAPRASTVPTVMHRNGEPYPNGIDASPALELLLKQPQRQDIRNERHHLDPRFTDHLVRTQMGTQQNRQGIIQQHARNHSQTSQYQQMRPNTIHYSPPAVTPANFQRIPAETNELIRHTHHQIRSLTPQTDGRFLNVPRCCISQPACNTSYAIQNQQVLQNDYSVAHYTYQQRFNLNSQTPRHRQHFGLTLPIQPEATVNSPINPPPLYVDADVNRIIDNNGPMKHHLPAVHPLTGNVYTGPVPTIVNQGYMTQPYFVPFEEIPKTNTPLRIYPAIPQQ